MSHNFDLHHLSFFRADSGSSIGLDDASSSFSRSRKDQPQSIAHPCGPPLCTPYRKRLNDSNNKNVKLIDHASHRASSQRNPHLRNLYLAEYSRVRLFRIKY